MENNFFQEIKKIRTEIKPRPEWVALSRDILLQQINPQKEFQPVKVGLGGYFSFVTQLVSQHVFEPVVVMLLIFATFAGSSLTINAAFYSMPGQPLYRVKLALEKTHAAMVISENDKVELKMEFAQKRMDELDKIVRQSDLTPEAKKKQIEIIVSEFKNNVSAASSHLTKLTEDIKKSEAAKPADSELTVRMAMTISDKTKDLAESFTANVGKIDDAEIKQLVTEAAQSAQATSVAAKQIADEAALPANEGAAGTVEGAENAGEAEADENASASSTPKVD